MIVKLRSDGNTRHAVAAADISVVTSWYENARHMMKVVMRSGAEVVVEHVRIADADAAYAEVMAAWSAEEEER